MQSISRSLSRLALCSALVAAVPSSHGFVSNRGLECRVARTNLGSAERPAQTYFSPSLNFVDFGERNADVLMPGLPNANSCILSKAIRPLHNIPFGVEIQTLTPGEGRQHCPLAPEQFPSGYHFCDHDHSVRRESISGAPCNTGGELLTPAQIRLPVDFGTVAWRVHSTASTVLRMNIEPFGPHSARIRLPLDRQWHELGSSTLVEVGIRVAVECRYSF